MKISLCKGAEKKCKCTDGWRKRTDDKGTPSNTRLGQTVWSEGTSYKKVYSQVRMIRYGMVATSWRYV